MDEPDLEDIIEQYWDKYLSHCFIEEKRPSYKDFMIWYEEQDAMDVLV